MKRAFLALISIVFPFLPPATLDTSAQQQSDNRRDERPATGAVNNQGIVIGTELVNVLVTVTDSYGRFVKGLGEHHFEVYDQRVKQEISHFSDEDAPISIGVVYDTSGSMKGRIDRSIRALRRFIETSHEDDEFFLMAFNDRAVLAQDYTAAPNQILGRLMFADPRGSTALYDAAYLAVEKVKQGRHNKKALLIISDGQDNRSRYSYRELRNRVRESDVQIYVIGITDPFRDSLAGFGRSILEEVARMTGGRAFFPSADNEMELVEICARIALELRHQYSIGFYPSDIGKENQWRKLRVRVNAPRGLGRLSLTHREGYTAFGR